MKSWRSKWITCSIVLLVMTFLIGLAGYFRPRPLERLERQTLDWRMAKRPQPDPGTDIVTVIAGEETFAVFGQWPWPRTYHARVLGQLGLARAVVLDILFPEESDPQDDAALVQVVRALENVVLAMHVTPDAHGVAEHLVPPMVKLLEAGAAAGITNITPDIDGLIRFTQPAYPLDGKMFPSLPLAAASLISGNTAQFLPNDRGAWRLQLGSRQFELDRQGRLWMPFTGNPYSRFEYHQVLTGEIDPEVFRDKIVVLGIAAAGAEDFFMVPSRNGTQLTTGAAINATMLDTLLNGRSVQRTTALRDALLACALALICALLALRLRPGAAIVATLALVVLYTAGTLVLIVRTAVWVGLVWPVIGGLLAHAVMALIQFKIIHQEWEIKSLSLHSMYGLPQHVMQHPARFEDYLTSVWPQVEKTTGIKLLAGRTSLPQGIDLEAVSRPEPTQGHDIIQINHGQRSPRHQMLIPILQQSQDQAPAYTHLGWHRSAPQEALQTVCTLVLSASWFFSVISATQAKKDLLLNAINALFTALDYRDPITGGHSIRVAAITRDILKQMDVGDTRAEDIYLGALLHDVGKIGIPDEILQKKEMLDTWEQHRIQSHSSIGEQIMQQVHLPRDAQRGLRDHHERYDGSGYPAGLKGEEISLGGRVIAVADVFDALLNDRPYRKGLSMHAVCDFIHDHAGTHFDPAIVTILLDLKAPQDWKPSTKTRPAVVNF